MMTVLGAGFFGVNLGLFLQVYAGKSYFLLGRRTAIALAGITAIPWTLNEYARESRQLGLNSIDKARSKTIKKQPIFFLNRRVKIPIEPLLMPLKNFRKSS